jgi:tRNA-5-methyluridine54 2-sulfurtransferase
VSYIRCHKCDQRAAMRMKHHRLNLCAEHYIEYIQKQTLRSIKNYRMFNHSERVLVAVSGGKDSLALWDVLLVLGYKADGFYIDLGIDEDLGYSAQSRRMAEQFAQEKGVQLTVVDFAGEYGVTIGELARHTRRGTDKPCSVCGIAKRHTMNAITQQGGYDVIATGHNLDDEAAVLFSNTLRWDTDMMMRQSPVLEAHHGMPRKVKPFFRFYERETAAYALLRGIDYIQDECPFAQGSRTIELKHILNRLEDQSAGAKLNFYMNYLKAQEQKFFNRADDEATKANLNRCPDCGQPTTADGLCGFCRLLAQSQR